MSRNARIALVVAVVAAAVVAFVIADPGGGGGGKTSSATTPAAAGGARTTAAGKPAPPPIPVVRVRNAKPVGGVKEITVKKGGRVRFAVVSDVGDEIHVHGYDLKQDVPAGGRVAFSFPASIDGVFVIELESRGEQIASLKVTP